MKASYRVSALLFLFAAAPAAGRSIHFGDNSWIVRSSGDTRQNPGLNYFSDSEENVWVDAEGRLHLRITWDAVTGRWSCAEVSINSSMGYGVYSYGLGSSTADLDPQAVLSMFGEMGLRLENRIDISSWGDPLVPAWGTYRVKELATPAKEFTWKMPVDADGSSHVMLWTRTSTRFQTTAADGTIVADWTAHGAAELLDRHQQSTISLWLEDGQPPQDGQPVEMIITAADVEDF